MRNISWRTEHKLDLEGFGDIVRRQTVLGRATSSVEAGMILAVYFGDKAVWGWGRGEDQTMKCSSCQGEEDPSHAKFG